MDNTALWAAVAGVGVVLGLLLWRARTALPYHARGQLFSQGELVFYRALQEALAPLAGHVQIMGKVRLADIVTCSQAEWRRGFGRAIAGKHIDFIIVNHKDSQILLCIELDDLSHNDPDRQDRDVFVDDVLRKTGVPLLRVVAERRYDVRRLREVMAPALKPYKLL